MAEPVSTGLLVAAAAGPVVGGLIGGMSASKGRREQQKMIKRAIAELQAVGLPPNLSREIIFKEFERVGILTPQLEEDIQVSASEVANLTEDPLLRINQLQALDMMKQRAKTGFGPQEMAAQAQITTNAARNAEAKRQQVISDAARKGMDRSGAGLVAQLLAAQSGDELVSSEGDRLMSMMADRIRQGASDLASTSSQVRSQDFQAELARRQAADERNRFIAQNSIARQRSNVDRLNQAQLANLSEQQRVADTNTQMANAERLRQVQAQRDYWQDRFSYGSAMANARLGAASSAGAQAQAQANMFQGIGNAIGTGLGGIASYQQNQAALDAYKKANGIS